MYRFGVDARKYPNAATLGPLGLIKEASDQQFEGLFFRTIFDLSPTLDLEELRRIRAEVDSHGLYLEVGLGKVNPFNTAEAPEVRAAGNGDYLLGMERMIHACSEIGCHELWADTANYQRYEWGIHANDRFRTDVSWGEQLEATHNFLQRIAPLLRHYESRINLETHEEITTYELVRLIERVGPDVTGITLDLANVVIRGENPMDAARRAAPFVHLTHIRDVILTFRKYGLERDVRACGDGVVNWSEVVDVLTSHQSSLNFSVEAVSGPGRNRIEIFDPVWQRAHPDLAISEVLDLIQMAHATGERMLSGEIPGSNEYYPEDGLDSLGQVQFMKKCLAHLRDLVGRT